MAGKALGLMLVATSTFYVTAALGPWPQPGEGRSEPGGQQQQRSLEQQGRRVVEERALPRPAAEEVGGELSQLTVELHHVEDGLAEYALELDNPGDYAVWGAGERDEMRAIRAHFRKTVGLAKDDVVVFGYWKRGVSTTEIDQNRLRNYTSILENGGTLADIDDLAIGI